MAVPEKLTDTLETLEMVADRSERIQLLIDIAGRFEEVPPRLAPPRQNFVNTRATVSSGMPSPSSLMVMQAPAVSWSPARTRDGSTRTVIVPSP